MGNNINIVQYTTHSLASHRHIWAIDGPSDFTFLQKYIKCIHINITKNVHLLNSHIQACIALQLWSVHRHKCNAQAPANYQD